MAARENQGLQITLILFVMATVVLSVTTFIFVRNYQHQRELTDKAQKAESAATENMRKTQDERNELATVLGFAISESREDIAAKTQAEIAKYANIFPPQTPPEQRTYSKLVEELAKALDAKNKELLAAKQTNDKLNSDLKDNEAKWKQTLAAHEAAMNKAIQAEKANQASYISQIAELTKTAQNATAAVSQRDKALQDLKAQLEGELRKARDDLQRAQSVIQNQQGVIAGYEQIAPTVPDGRIRWVNQRDNTVFIDVGSADGLQRRISFSVYDRNAGDAAKAVRKGSIEVLNIRGPHLAEARIMETINADPIVPGDIIYSPIWDPGQTQHFAIAGLIDFDNDGISDLAKLQDLIRYNGGVVDAVVDEKGNVTGEITNRTQHLILGQPPSDSSPEAVTAFSELRRQATASGVPFIKVDAFLAQIGYSPRSAGATAVNTSGPRSIRAPADTPDRSTSSGQGFRERRPPAGGKNGY